MIWKWILQNIAKVNLKTYLFFLIITSVLWLMMKLSDQYNKTLEIPLAFTEIKAGYMLVNKPINSLEIAVSAEGFKMLSFAVRNNDPLSVSLNNIELYKTNDGYWRGSLSTESLKNALSSQFDINEVGKKIKPDSIIFFFDKIDTVDVNVMLNSKLSVISGFRIYGNPKITPEKIRVIGSKHITDTLKEIQTIPLIRKKLNASFQSDIGLINDNALLKLSTKKVKVSVNVVEFIEAETKVPITVFSNIPNLKVKTFPTAITIKYQVAMPDYNKMLDSLFVVGVEIDSLSALRNSSLIPKIIKVPKFLENPRLSINKVDFIILNQ